MKRQIVSTITGYPTKDGAGVSLVRVLGNTSAKDYDPILMLDSFDSTNPADYIAGFPLHPHRGIETISYIYRGAMQHKDSLGNEDTISDGEVQWMTAGSGILHEEKLPASPHLLGVQLWLNLPAKDKMVSPNYHAIKKEDIKEIPFEGGYLRLLAGNYKENKGYQSQYLPVDYYDIHLKSGNKFYLETAPDKTAFIFTLSGHLKVDGRVIQEKTAALLSAGDSLSLEASDKDAQVLFFSSEQLNESISWGGPIVMNTQEELRTAFIELENGTFLKEQAHYEA